MKLPLTPLIGQTHQQQPMPASARGGLFGEEQEQGANGVASHDHEERDLPNQGGPAREQREGAVVGQDDAQDVADDNSDCLDASDQTGIVHDAAVDASSGGPEEIPAEAKRIAGGDENALPFQNEQRQVVGGDVTKRYRDQAVNEESGQRGSWGLGQPAGDQAGGRIAAKHEGNEAQKAKCAENNAGNDTVLD